MEKSSKSSLRLTTEDQSVPLHRADSLLGSHGEPTATEYSVIWWYHDLFLQSLIRGQLVFLGFRSFKPCSYEFPHACIISHIRKHICKENSYKWICWVNAYGFCLFWQLLQNCFSWTVYWFILSTPTSDCVCFRIPAYSTHDPSLWS